MKYKILPTYYIVILAYKLFIICQKNLNKISIIHRINVWERSFNIIMWTIKKSKKIMRFNFFEIDIKILLNYRLYVFKKKRV